MNKLQSTVHMINQIHHDTRKFKGKRILNKSRKAQAILCKMKRKEKGGKDRK